MEDREFGLVLINGRMLYGWKHGFGYTWMPKFIMNIIVTVWNFFACKILGHEWFDYEKAGEPNGNTECVNCDKIKDKTKER